MNIKTALLIAGLVLAPVAAHAESGFFLAAGVGSADLNEDFDGFTVDTDSTAFRLTAGWRFSKYVAVEAGYLNFGRFEQTLDIGGVPSNVELKADGFTLGGTGNLPLGSRFGLFARAGWFFWDGDAEINSVSSANPGDTNFYIGAGVRFSATDRLAFTADTSRYALEDADSDVITLGLDFRF